MISLIVGLIVLCLIYLIGVLLLRPVVFVLFRFHPFLSIVLASFILSACIVFSSIVMFYF